ncbi:hypothetical protein Pcinc_008282 [Petrolisthes cinctipes]|uniref:Cadherin domain-containing protein n=1 Tax=Petrolisthes cinctipes TaxID=88211 RepID=A0AAE1G943_PETCI|nr:hypothetical protein Pcinc_008282 [Petrolisthes cinctipes]
MKVELVLEVTIRQPLSLSNTALSSTTNVAVNVLDENDHAPVFLERLYKLFVPVIPHHHHHQQPQGYVEHLPIGRVKAADNGHPQKSNSYLVLINLVPILKLSPNPTQPNPTRGT